MADRLKFSLKLENSLARLARVLSATQVLKDLLVLDIVEALKGVPKIVTD